MPAEATPGSDELGLRRQAHLAGRFGLKRRVVRYCAPMAGDTVYGFPRDAWRAAVEQASARLMSLARARQTTTYSELCSAVTAIDLKPYSFAMMALLNQVCAEADRAYGVMLASLVTRRDTGLPGDGYFAFAEALGRDVTDQRAFWEAEVERIHAAFAEEG